MLLSAPIKNKTSISITPLIDVVFILLLFFMLSSTFQKEKQIEMKSSASGGETTKQDKSHKILLNTDDMIFINGVKYLSNSEEFKSYLLSISKNNEQVTLVANPDVKTQKFIELLDHLRNSGIVNLNISKSELP